MTKHMILLVVLAAAACGGKNKNNADTTGGGPTIDPNMSSGDSTDRSGDVDPTKLDEVNQLLERRRNIVSRCLSNAVEAGEAPKNARGKVTLEIKIGTDGKASSVEVIKSSIESKEVQGCVKRKVEEIEFPHMNKAFETSYTYAMETN